MNLGDHWPSKFQGFLLSPSLIKFPIHGGVFPPTHIGAISFPKSMSRQNIKGHYFAIKRIILNSAFTHNFICSIKNSLVHSLSGRERNIESVRQGCSWQCYVSHGSNRINPGRQTLVQPQHSSIGGEFVLRILYIPQVSVCISIWDMYLVFNSFTIYNQYFCYYVMKSCSGFMP